MPQHIESWKVKKLYFYLESNDNAISTMPIMSFLNGFLDERISVSGSPPSVFL